MEYTSFLNIRPLDAEIQKLASDFHCGNVFIDSFLRSDRALDDGFGKTFVWLEAYNKGIIGFYNISTGGIDQLDDMARYKMGGSIHLNEFAIALPYHGVSAADDLDILISDMLLMECLRRVLFLRSTHLGFAFITLQSTDDGLKLYQRNGFEVFEEDMDISILQNIEEKCTPMYLALDIE